MLQDMRHSTDKLRQLFWDQEKKIEYLRRDLDQIEDKRRQLEKQREDIKLEGTQLAKSLEIKKMELAVEKENESAILKHQVDLQERLQELNAEIMNLEEKQRMLSEKLQQFVEENEKIRQHLYRRDRQAELKSRINSDVIKTSDMHVRASMSPVRDRDSPYRDGRHHGIPSHHGPPRDSSPLRHPH